MRRMLTNALAVALLLATGCGRRLLFRPVATATDGTTTVILATPTGAITPGRNDLQLRFTRGGTVPVEVNRATVVVRLGPPSASGVHEAPSIQQSPPLSHVGTGLYRTRYDLNAPGLYQIYVTWSEGRQNHLATFAARIPMPGTPAPTPPRT